MEGRHKVSGGRLAKFSEQQLVDCQKSGCHGCGGGQMDKGFDYYKSHEAVDESSYPYTGKDGSCKDGGKRGTGVNSHGHTDVQRNNPNAMKTALQGGPLSVAIQAN